MGDSRSGPPDAGQLEQPELEPFAFAGLVLVLAPGHLPVPLACKQDLFWVS